MKSFWENFKEKWNRSLQNDKQGHFKLGALFGLTAVSGIWMGIWGYIGALFLGHLVGVGIELWQSTTTHRHVDSVDYYSTACGANLVSLMVMICIESLKGF